MSTTNRMGKGISTIRLVMSIIIIALVMLSIGVYLLNKKDTYDGKAEATIKSITNDKCESYTKQKSSGKTETYYKCILNYDFVVDGKTYTCKGTYDGRSPKLKGDIVSVIYDPSKNKISSTNSKTIGMILIGMSILIFVIGLVMHLVVMNVKGAVTVVTGMTVLDGMGFRKTRR